MKVLHCEILLPGFLFTPVVALIFNRRKMFLPLSNKQEFEDKWKKERKKKNCSIQPEIPDWGD